jgi:uncharacterized membrane protein
VLRIFVQNAILQASITKKNMNKTVPIKQSLKWGWHIFKNNKWLLVKLTLFMIIASGMFSAMTHQRGLARHDALLFLILRLAGIALSLFLSLGMMKIFLSFKDSSQPKFEDLFSQGHLLWNYFLATFLYILIVSVGLVMFIVPGIIWAIKYRMYAFLIVDKHMTPLESLRKSVELTDGVKWKLLLFGIVSFFVLLLGLIALIIGIFAAIPIIALAQTYIYRHLLSQTDSIA